MTDDVTAEGLNDPSKAGQPNAPRETRALAAAFPLRVLIQTPWRRAELLELSWSDVVSAKADQH